MVLWPRGRPVVGVCCVECWTLANWCQRISTSDSERTIGDVIIEVGDAVVAAVLGATLVSGAVTYVGCCVVTDACLTICILVERR